MKESLMRKSRWNIWLPHRIGLVALAATSLLGGCAEKKVPVAVLPAPWVIRVDDNEPVGDFERLAEIFGAPGLPSIRGKTWVAVDRGPANRPTELEGWLIKDGAKSVLILDWHGELHTLRRPASDENRPRIKEEKDGEFLWSTIKEAGCSVAWKIREEDYAAKSKKFLTQGLPENGNTDGTFDMVWRGYGFTDHVVAAARFAHFADQLGQKARAADLLAHAHEAYREHKRRYVGSSDREVAIHVFVADHIALGYRNRAIFGAHYYRMPRKELKKLWERVAELPHHQYRNEAKAMAKHYQALLEEDARWVEPDAKALAKMTTDQKVAYWLYHLRDLNAGQWSDPGSCYVLSTIFLNGLLDRDPSGALIRVSTPVKTDIEDARRRAEQFLRVAAPSLHMALQPSR